MAFNTVVSSSVTTAIKGAAYADGATLSGTWTANYNSTGGLVSVTDTTFTVSGPGGTNTFTKMGTLPYAQDPTASGFTSYEIHDLGRTGAGTYNSLYVDWKTTAPSSFDEGSPSLFTSVKNSAATAPTASIRLVSDGSASASSNAATTCFLRGTMIATLHGETAVESLAPGDLVIVVEHGIHVGRPVTWVGGGAMDAAHLGNRDEAFPVRIRKDAFADGSPTRDLLVTPEHCILTEAGLTPVRMLVNGRSILIDRSMPNYDFHHVELAAHGILLAEGLATESYLDTGNRGLFIDGGVGASVRQTPVTAAPLAVARTVVEPVWSRLADRARSLGFADNNTVVVVTDRPELRLLLDTGAELAAFWQEDRRHSFHIPRQARPVRLLSRASAPAETIGPFVDDRRSLGVKINKLVLWDGLNDTVIPFAGLALDGWHEAEGGFRWTNGNAALDMPPAGTDTYLDIHLEATALYAISPPPRTLALLGL